MRLGNSVVNPVYILFACVVGSTLPLDEGHFVRGLQSNPRDANLRVAYGRWLLRMSRPAEAEVEARSAVAARPWDSALRVELATLLEEAGDASGAEAEFAKALAACEECA